MSTCKLIQICCMFQDFPNGPAYRKEGERHWDKMCTIFAEPDSDQGDSSDMQTTNQNVPVITISSSHDGTPPKPKKSIGRRIFGSFIGGRVNEGQTSTHRQPIARRLVTDPAQPHVLGNPAWVVTPDPDKPRFSIHGGHTFNSDQFSSTGLHQTDPVIVDEASNSSMPIFRRTQSSRVQTNWSIFQDALNNNNQTGPIAPGPGGIQHGSGSSSIIPF